VDGDKVRTKRTAQPTTKTRDRQSTEGAPDESKLKASTGESTAEVTPVFRATVDETTVSAASVDETVTDETNVTPINAEADASASDDNTEPTKE